MKLNNQLADKVRSSEHLRTQREEYYHAAHSRRRQTIRRVTGIILLVCVIIISYKLVRLHFIKEQIATVQTSVTKVDKNNKRLKKQVKLLHDDDYLQQLIRDKYMYTKKGEVVYNLPNSDSSSEN
ncbi:FtsB family cell division protein [Periweissella beninensis]|uniref:Septum formation initiator family protein n=1 Tax=Periweissella beninensis TaxID=504936 RepID=A0ABT0VJ40_9LACO|nr:septum formation initiator family protein [Periweissella beninensis]MBM7544384.1 cell division protein DivIC [Periweissella beninensis]MCM2437850.1 septum formation initiator family protein [Periweissella beninensis]